MQENNNLTPASIFAILLLVIGLALVRVYQQELFYDPFLDFFKSENYKGQMLPPYDQLRLFLSLAFRYFINSVLSLSIIYYCFKDHGILKTAAFLYAALFVALIVALYIILSADNPNTLILFYVRRFIIQPLFLILFVPAFYYQGKMK